MCIRDRVEGNKSHMRSILTKEEADDLVDHREEIGLMWIPNEKQREEKYKDALRTCECQKWIGIIKTLYMRKQDRISQNISNVKMLPATLLFFVNLFCRCCLFMFSNHLICKTYLPCLFYFQKLNV